MTRPRAPAPAPVSLDLHTIDLQNGSALIGSDLHAWPGVSHPREPRYESGGGAGEQGA